MSTNKKNEPAIEIKNITKEFILPKYQNDSLKQLIVHGFKRNEKTKHTVLNDVSFTINKGDFFGIVGRNGSGKSTLLKLICGIYTPTAGEIVTHGKITPFIELGVGFNPELSGRDNVYLNGALLGFNRAEMHQMYDEIVAFAELEDFMDLKLKNFSSGMQVRLAFSIAIKAKNDILVFDEVLAVGDEAFQRKCMKVFEEYRRRKQTVILVTHSMENVRMLCTKALMVEDGKVKVSGEVKKVADAYQKANSFLADDTIKSEDLNSVAKFIAVMGGKDLYNRGDFMKLKIRWPSCVKVHKIGVAIIKSTGEYVFGSNTGKKQLVGLGVDYSVELNLGPGRYFVTVVASGKDDSVIDLIKKACVFLVSNQFETEVDGLTRFTYKYSKPKD